MSCNIPETSKKFSETLAGAKDKMNGLVADADKGIASALGSLQGDLAAEKEKLLADVEGMVPEIPKPQANLQEEMTKLLEQTDDPGAMVQTFAKMKEAFGTATDLDKMLDKIGLDAGKLNDMDSKLADAIAGGNKLINDATGAIDQAIGNGLGALSGAADAAKDKLLGAATGKADAIKDAIGADGQIGLPGTDLKAAKDAICGQVPNIDIDADGNPVKKGLPATQPTEDAKKVVEKAETKKEVAPEETKQNEHIADRKDLKMYYWNQQTLEQKLEYNDYKAKKRKKADKAKKKIVKEQRQLAKKLKRLKRRGRPVDQADVKRNKALIRSYYLIIDDHLTSDWADPKLNFGLKVELDKASEWEAKWRARFPSREAMDQELFGQSDLTAYVLSNLQHEPFKTFPE